MTPNFPIRLRRLRTSATLRRMVSETQLSPNDFIYPLFVTHGEWVRNPIASMPGIAQLSVDQAVKETGEALELGIPAVILFGIPAEKDLVGLENFASDGIVQQATRALKETYPDLMVITDVCLCEYTSHGHCGLVRGEEILNDETLEILQRAHGIEEGYRDVAERIETIETQIAERELHARRRKEELDSLYCQALEAMDEGEWETAIERLK